MVSRRPHRKSRLGCTTCKQRRIKCDESGPPCGPCASKSIECKYARGSTRGSRSSVEALDEYANTAASSQTAPSTNTLSPARTEWPDSVRQLELQLLHKWTTETYKSYCGTVDDEYYNWQVIVPRLAFKHECLLDGILAMTALEVSAFSESNGVAQEYLDIALNYQNRASSKLREELSSSDLSAVSQEKHQAMWALSSILMVLGLAIPPFTMENGNKYSMLEHMMTYFELMKGLVIIVAGKIKSHKDDPLLAKYREWHELDVLPIAADTQLALDRLKDLNEEVHGASRSGRGMSELKAISYHAACRQAIFFLEECFAKCSEHDTRAYGLAWLMMSGNDYIAAIKELEPVSLLILMHWGVFLEQQSYGIWYAERVGKYLVRDLSDGSTPTDNQKMTDGILWVRKQVGLE